MVTFKRPPCLIFLAIIVFVLFVRTAPTFSAEAQDSGEPRITVAEDMGGVVKREADKLKEEFKEKTKSLFYRDRLGWDLDTIKYLYTYVISLPGLIPQITGNFIERSRILGVVGSLLILLFLAVVLYSFIGRARVLKWATMKLQPLGVHIPEKYYALYVAFLNIFIAALIPLLLLGLFDLISALFSYEAAWFTLIRRLLGLWAVSSMIFNFLKETLTRDFFRLTAQYGKTLFLYARLLLLFVFAGITAFWIAEAFDIRSDALALLDFIVSISIVSIGFSFLLKKEAFLSLLPDFSFSNYRKLISFITNYYFPLLTVSFIAALLWCLGFEILGRTILAKIWFTLSAFMAVILLYHVIGEKIQKWSRKVDPTDETAHILINAINALLVYTVIVTSIIIAISLLGLLDPIQRLMSFPIFKLGESSVTLWIIIKALLILLAFLYASRFLQSYFDYKVYPMLGIDAGLGYAINTLFKYLSFAVGILISLEFVGIDLRFLLVFAGAAGIGIGLGLQNMASNVIAGFTIIFGGKVRKGDWVEVSGTMGMVKEVYLNSTRVATRDDIEYLIPNSQLVSSTIVNYSLTSPLIRVSLPVGVAYNSDPKQVEQILLDAARKEPLVSRENPPVVRFAAYADNSINFDLLFWIDVRKVPGQLVRSELYFAIFEEFRKAGIEIPFPQRDVHIRSMEPAV